ncbi:hypothetical protein GOODEAATRI_009205 [Goodea atripinnis]|uniref:PH domain-containing protein n=1 Tax=Goodea atripinnis TaxID=208336 RepID=A0ABV0MGB4_9TELE
MWLSAIDPSCPPLFLLQKEKVRISFRSAGDDRQLRQAFVRRWFESPRLSIASFSSDERTPSATPSDSSGQRPVSLISTVSSGSGSSREDYLAPTRVSEGSSSINLNQNLSPENKGRSFIHKKNSNNKVWTPIRALSRREQASPFIAATMAPNPQLTYLDRVIMEIIETERMYVRDLRMIVDVSHERLRRRLFLSHFPLFGPLILHLFSTCLQDYLAHIIDESDLSNHPELVFMCSHLDLPVPCFLLNPSDLTTYGELVLEGSFKVPRARHERTLFLFDRMLLITKRRGEHYIYKTHISVSKPTNKQALMSNNWLRSNASLSVLLQSSTLLLIESAKDSLSFSVSHYKHLKQPHTVQAKTVEEKKLWAHHIKRIILENHPAAIPQKAKEAILEMDSICEDDSLLLFLLKLWRCSKSLSWCCCPAGPPRYRYSPERLKKAVTEEFPREARQGRRQSGVHFNHIHLISDHFQLLSVLLYTRNSSVSSSEPTKQILKRTKGKNAIHLKLLTSACIDEHHNPGKPSQITTFSSCFCSHPVSQTG